MKIFVSQFFLFLSVSFFSSILAAKPTDSVKFILGLLQFNYIFHSFIYLCVFVNPIRAVFFLYLMCALHVFLKQDDFFFCLPEKKGFFSVFFFFFSVVEIESGCPRFGMT